MGSLAISMKEFSFFSPLKVCEVATEYFRIVLFRMSFIMLLDLEDSFSEYVPLFEIFWQY
jgi:hypothetical protein